MANLQESNTVVYSPLRDSAWSVNRRDQRGNKKSIYHNMSITTSCDLYYRKLSRWLSNWLKVYDRRTLIGEAIITIKVIGHHQPTKSFLSLIFDFLSNFSFYTFREHHNNNFVDDPSTHKHDEKKTTTRNGPFWCGPRIKSRSFSTMEIIFFSLSNYHFLGRLDRVPAENQAHFAHTKTRRLLQIKSTSCGNLAAVLGAT